MQDPSGRIQCQVGCCHCCYRVPEASIPELALIWDTLSGFSQEELKAIRSRVQQYVTETAPKRPEQLGQVRSACPLLVDSRCSIYEARPLSCRGLNSTNASACESIRLGSRPPKDRPTWADFAFHTMALRMGMRLGVFFEGLPPETVDLGHALSVLLEHPDSIEQYLEGKDRFSGSQSNFKSEQFDANRISNTNGPAFIAQAEMDLPSGNLPVKEASFLREQNNEYLRTGDFEHYTQSLGGHSVGAMMARITVPRVPLTEAEIDESRARFLVAMREFVEENFPPAQAFDALSFHQTMNLAYQGRDDVEILREHGDLIMGI